MKRALGLYMAFIFCLSGCGSSSQNSAPVSDPASANPAPAPAPAPHALTVFIAGDSTASFLSANPDPQTRKGWGQELPAFLEASVKVENFAQGGRSSRSFINEGWLDKIRERIRPGDVLLIQFGHNDEKCVVEMNIALLCTAPEPDATVPDNLSFPKNLEQFVEVARRAGAYPILMTPVTRRPFDNKGQPLTATHTILNPKSVYQGDYAEAVRRTAFALQVPLVDLDALSRDFFIRIGDQGSREYYLYDQGLSGEIPYSALDNTHFRKKGAQAVSGMIAGEIYRQDIHPLSFKIVLPPGLTVSPL